MGVSSTKRAIAASDRVQWALTLLVPRHRALPTPRPPLAWRTTRMSARAACWAPQAAAWTPSRCPRNRLDVACSGQAGRGPSAAADAADATSAPTGWQAAAAQLPRRAAGTLLAATVAAAATLGGAPGLAPPPAAAVTQEQLLFLEAWRAVDRAYVDKKFNGLNWFKVGVVGAAQRGGSRPQGAGRGVARECCSGALQRRALAAATDACCSGAPQRAPPAQHATPAAQPSPHLPATWQPSCISQSRRGRMR